MYLERLIRFRSRGRILFTSDEENMTTTLRRLMIERLSLLPLFLKTTNHTDVDANRKVPRLETCELLGPRRFQFRSSLSFLFVPSKRKYMAL